MMFILFALILLVGIQTMKMHFDINQLQRESKKEIDLLRDYVKRIEQDVQSNRYEIPPKYARLDQALYETLEAFRIKNNLL